MWSEPKVAQAAPRRMEVLPIPFSATMKLVPGLRCSATLSNARQLRSSR